jgi:DNA modification methylase
VRREDEVREGRRNPTATSSFGVGRRESHDATGFYSRFEAPELSDDDDVSQPFTVSSPFVHGDARDMAAVPDGSVALVVTSPPYFAGKKYEEELDREGVPGSYLEYLELLRDVFAECKRTLEPGGRIAVNVANLGRKPYRSLSADVIHILQDELRLLLRGEVVWQKGEGASGSCAWGSFRSAANPVLRDVTERVIIASKGRFDRARKPKERAQQGLPHVDSLTNDEFLEATLDVWSIAPESARRVQHPAPFPVGLPLRLIHLYTYVGDLVLDPFMGSGTTLVAAAKSGRRYIGYDLDENYVGIARSRVAESLTKRSSDDGVHARAAREKKSVLAIAERTLSDAGFTVREQNHRFSKLGVSVSFLATDAGERPWYFDVSGAFTTTTGGMMRSDTAWRSLGRAHVLAQNKIHPVVFLTSHLPRRGTEADVALRAAGPKSFFDAIEMLSGEGQERLARYAQGGHSEIALPGFWKPRDLEDG